MENLKNVTLVSSDPFSATFSRSRGRRNRSGEGESFFGPFTQGVARGLALPWAISFHPYGVSNGAGAKVLGLKSAFIRNLRLKIPRPAFASISDSIFNWLARRKPEGGSRTNRTNRTDRGDRKSKVQCRERPEAGDVRRETEITNAESAATLSGLETIFVGGFPG